MILLAHSWQLCILQCANVTPDELLRKAWKLENVIFILHEYQILPRMSLLSQSKDVAGAVLSPMKTPLSIAAEPVFRKQRVCQSDDEGYTVFERNGHNAEITP